jgi:aminoglycoside phosphotransferase (APT) family kinase protein
MSRGKTSAMESDSGSAQGHAPKDSREQFQHVVHGVAPGSTLIRAWHPGGGTSAQVTALEALLVDGTVSRMLMRQYGEADLTRNPDVATHELMLLHVLHGSAVAAPQPYLLDESGRIFPTTYIVEEYIEGACLGIRETDDMREDEEPNCEEPQVKLEDVVRQMAEQLAAIHRVDIARLDFLPRQNERLAQWFATLPAAGDESSPEGRAMAALKSAWPPVSQNKPCLLHGDFWPGNVLWQDGRLVGVIDWEDAEIGDPVGELANTRLELLWAYGSKAAALFTRNYREINGIDLSGLPYWDLLVALQKGPRISEWGLDKAQERKMRAQCRKFMVRLLEQVRG